jgi:hypothetical protein
MSQIDGSQIDGILPPGTYMSPARNPLGDAVGDPSYVNVTLQIDPNWYLLSLLSDSNQAQFLYTSLTFVFVSLGEQGFSEAVNVNYATTDIVGREEQYYTYMGTSNRQIAMTFHFITQGEPAAQPNSYLVSTPPEQQQGYTGKGGPQLETVLPARWIDSLKYPVVDNNGLSHAPPPLILTVGDLLAARVVLSQSSLQWLPPFEPGTMNPFGAELACTFTVVRAAKGSSTPNLSGNLSQYSEFLNWTTQGPSLSSSG